MALNPIQLPDSFKRYIDPADKKQLGIAAATMEELLFKQKVKQERGKGGLHDLIRQYLNLRDIPHDCSATHKRHTNKKGTADFSCCVPPHGRWLSIEAKVDAPLTKEQLDAAEKITKAGGIAIIARSLQDVKATLDWMQR